MFFSKLHSLYWRVVNKINRTLKRNSWKKTPANSSTTFFKDGIQLLDPHLLGRETIKNLISNNEVIKEVLLILKKLESNHDVEFISEFYEKGLRLYGDKWVYADINTALVGLSKIMDIENYMEIGVRRGRSLCMLGSQKKTANLYGFDMWIEDYHNSPNPGPDFVNKELDKFDFQGKVNFINGDSKTTVPNFFKENPNLFFDLITIDGDHSLKGAYRDIKNVLPRLKIGGAIIFDDISSHEHLYLNKLWTKEIKNKNNFYSYEYTDTGLGIAVGIKKY